VWGIWKTAEREHMEVLEKHVLLMKISRIPIVGKNCGILEIF